MSNKKKSNKMWGGRFSEKSADLLTQINSSIDIDKRLAFEDILGSKAHVEMLATTKIITKKTKTKILYGLKKIEKELIEGHFTFDALLEDIHMNIEARLGEIIGADAGRIHTARSRNDQVVTDFRLWIRKAIEDIEGELSKLQLSILKNAEKNTLDGIKFIWEEKWVHLRKSNTEPIIRIYAEAPDKNRALELIREIKSLI